MRIFCDYLDVTFAPDDCPAPELIQLLLGHDFTVSRDTGGSALYFPPKPERGSLVIQHRSRFARVSASGGVCAYLRSIGAWDDYLFILSSSPHKVTRLDAALDLPTDGADMIDVFRQRFPTGQASLTRKLLKMDYITAVRPDGRYTGTVSFGYGSAARFRAKVYDKSWEALQKRSEHLPPTSRFEVTACKDSGATLRDASMPAALFWHIASPALLKAPSEGVPVWVPNSDYHYSLTPRAFDPAETLKRRIDFSAELEAFVCIADSMGPAGRDYLKALLCKRIDGAPPAASSSDAA